MSEESTPESAAVGELYPDLDHERHHLTFARACRDAMIDRFSRVDPLASADELTAEYIELTVAEALEDLRTPGAGDSSAGSMRHRPRPIGRRRPGTSGGDTSRTSITIP